jgi:hypothetical protein
MSIYTAQRVVSALGLPGVNAFCRTEGQPEAVYIEVPPGGNRVRSYLDVEAPNGAPLAALFAFVDEACRGTRVERLPMSVSAGGFTLTFGCEAALAPAWREELKDLSRYLSLPAVPSAGP